MYPKATGIALLIGGFVHAIVNQYVMECVKKQIDGDVEILERIFNELWAKYKIPESYYKELRIQMLSFGEKGINFESVVSTEKSFLIEFSKGKFIKGIIDIVRSYFWRGIAKKDSEPILLICDYKNQANILSHEETLTEQLKIYTLAATMLWPGYKYYRRGIYYLKHGFIRCHEDEDNPTPIMDIEIEVEETKQMLIREWKKIKGSKDFPAIQGDWCYQYNGCPILLDHKCPVQDVDKGIEDWIRKIWEINTEVKSLRARVKSYITMNGNVKIDDKEIGYILSNSETYKLMPVVNVCTKTPIPIINDFNMGKIDMKKIIKEINMKVNAFEILQEFEKYRKVEEITKFDLKEKK